MEVLYCYICGWICFNIGLRILGTFLSIGLAEVLNNMGTCSFA